MTKEEKKDKKVKKVSTPSYLKRMQAYLKKYKEKIAIEKKKFLEEKNRLKEEKKRLKEERKILKEKKKTEIKIKYKKPSKKQDAAADWKKMQIHLKKIKDEKKKNREEKKKNKTTVKKVYKKTQGAINELPKSSGGSGGASNVRDVLLTNGLKQADTSASINKIENDVTKNLALIEKKLQEKNDRFDESHMISYIDKKYDRVNNDMRLLQANADTGNRYLIGFEDKLGEIENEQKYNSTDIKLLGQQANQAFKYVNNKILEKSRDKPRAIHGLKINTPLRSYTKSHHSSLSNNPPMRTDTAIVEEENEQENEEENEESQLFTQIKELQPVRDENENILETEQPFDIRFTDSIKEFMKYLDTEDQQPISSILKDENIIETEIKNTPKQETEIKNTPKQETEIKKTPKQELLDDKPLPESEDKLIKRKKKNEEIIKSIDEALMINKYTDKQLLEIKDDRNRYLDKLISTNEKLDRYYPKTIATSNIDSIAASNERDFNDYTPIRTNREDQLPIIVDRFIDPTNTQPSSSIFQSPDPELIRFSRLPEPIKHRKNPSVKTQARQLTNKELMQEDKKDKTTIRVKIPTLQPHDLLPDIEEEEDDGETIKNITESLLKKKKTSKKTSVKPKPITRSTLKIVTDDNPLNKFSSIVNKISTRKK